MTAINAFSAARTAENFRAWSNEAPAAAATWLKAVAATVGAPELAQQVDTFAQAPDAAQQLTALFTTLGARQLASVQDARAVTLGWTAAPKGDAPALTGKVRVENGNAVLDTPAGSFELMSANFFELEQGNWRANHFLNGHDVVAFAGRTMTVKGWPEAGWAPGGRAKLAVEEFAPGASPDFVSGRVKVDGETVSIQVRPGKLVELRDPALVAALKPFDQLGVILPGGPTQEGDGYHFDANPAGYYILAGFRELGTKQADGTTTAPIILAHGRSVNGRFPSAVVDAGPPTDLRHYMFGSFQNGELVAQSYTPHAGAWTADGIKASPSTGFVEWATPLPGAQPVEDAQFAPRSAGLLARTQDERWNGYPVGDFEMKRGFGQVYPEYADRLGLPLENERDDGQGGSVQQFERGVMTWSPNVPIKVQLSS